MFLLKKQTESSSNRSTTTLLKKKYKGVSRSIPIDGFKIEEDDDWLEKRETIKEDDDMQFQEERKECFKKKKMGESAAAKQMKQWPVNDRMSEANEKWRPASGFERNNLGFWFLKQWTVTVKQIIFKSFLFSKAQSKVF